MVRAPSVRLDWANTFKEQLRSRGFALLASGEQVKQAYTAGLSLSHCHPELVFDDVEPAVADYILRSVRDGRDLPARYSPGVYEVLGREVRFTEIVGKNLAAALPVAWSMLRQDLKALRVTSAVAASREAVG